MSGWPSASEHQRIRCGWSPTKPYHTSSTSSTWSSSTSPAIRRCSSSSSPNKTVCFSSSRSSSPSGDRTTLCVPNSYPAISPCPSAISASSFHTPAPDSEYIRTPNILGRCEIRVNTWRAGLRRRGFSGSSLVVEDDFYPSFPARRPGCGDGFPVVLQPEARAYERLQPYLWSDAEREFETARLLSFEVLDAVG